MTVRRPRQPLEDHELHKVIARPFSASPEPSRKVMIARRYPARRQTHISSLKEDQKPGLTDPPAADAAAPVLLRPAPVEAGYRQGADPRGGDDLRFRHRQAQFSGQRQAQILIIHAFTQIQRRIGLLDPPMGGLMICVVGVAPCGIHLPLLAHPQQRRFLLGAGHRDTEIVCW